MAKEDDMWVVGCLGAPVGLSLLLSLLEHRRSAGDAEMPDVVHDTVQPA
jgi:hypothetical protein